MKFGQEPGNPLNTGERDRGKDLHYSLVKPGLQGSLGLPAIVQWTVRVVNEGYASYESLSSAFQNNMLS